MMDESKKVLKASSTERPDNRFEIRIFLRVFDDGTVRPLDKRQRRSATHTLKLQLEYMTYEEELEIKKNALRFDEKNHVHYTDFDYLTEERIRRCLAGWNLHDLFPEMYQKLFRVRRLLEDDSIEMWKKLPPLLRKAISNHMNQAMGSA